MARTPSRSERRAGRRARTLRPVHPNAGLEADYRRRLASLVERMSQDYRAAIKKTYAWQQGRIQEIGQDATPVDYLERLLARLGSLWERRFDRMAERMAEYFATSVEKRTAAQLRTILRDGGISVPMQRTEGIRTIEQAVVRENVALIKSIPTQYHTQVEGIVMRGVTNGRDQGHIAKELQKRLGVTKRRAALIARDQTSKATSAFHRVRMEEAGLFEAEWVHSGGAREPRHTHVKAGRDRVRYDIRKGWYDPDPRVRRHIHPGELINCGCISRPIVPGFD